MKVQLELHLDVDDDRQFIWWAAAPEVAGFYAAADQLHDLLLQAEEALAATFAEQVEIVPVIVRNNFYTSGDMESVPAHNRVLAVVA
jgi:predicted RNase H-like HicB family nuclease